MRRGGRSCSPTRTSPSPTSGPRGRATPTVAGHERPRRPALHVRPRVGTARGRAGCASASPTTRRTRWATSCSCSCRSGGHGRGGRDVQRGRVHQVGVRHLRPRRHRRRGQHRAGRRAAAPQRGSLRRGVDLRDRADAAALDALLDAEGYRRSSGLRRGRGQPLGSLVPCSATSAATGTRRARTSARPAGAALDRRRPTTTTITFTPVEAAGDVAEEELSVTLDDLHESAGMLVVKRGPTPDRGSCSTPR